MQKDIFICHATGDKSSVVRVLEASLNDKGLTCWVDEAEITLGENITERINEGLKNSAYVVVILSRSFMLKNRPKKESMIYRDLTVSYHHANDQYYRNRFEQLFSNGYDIMVSKSVQIGDINTNLPTETIRQKIRDEYLRDSTVTVVLIGDETWQRKHVDWEIASSIRNTQFNPRSGLIGILLPSYPRPYNAPNNYINSTIPPRLNDNIQCGFAKIYNWSESPTAVHDWIHEAFQRRNNINPDNSYDNFVNNRSGERWY